MKTVLSILLISSLLVLSNCKDEERESRKRGQDQFLFSIAMAGTFKPNFCSAPELLLEEGKVYNITLEAGKRFWFDYAIRSTGNIQKRFRLTITKDSSTELDYFVKNCAQNSSPGASPPKVNSPTELVYEDESLSYSNNASINANLRFFLDGKAGNSNISFVFVQF